MALANTSGASALAFQSTTFDAVMIDGKPWLRVHQIGEALEYKHPDRSMTNLYNANKDEFTDRMTAVVKLDTAGGAQDTRIFSLRGAHLLAMFARTAKAAEFRRWVLDVLDREVDQPAAEQPANTFTVQPSDKLSEAQQIALRALLEINAKKLPHAQQAGAMVKGWSKLKAHFGVSYRDIPAERFVEAMSIMARHVASFDQVEPVELKPDADLARRAFALSAEISSQVQRSVFDAVLAGDEPGDCLRWIFSLDLDRGQKSHTVSWLAPIERDAVVMNLSQLSRAIGNGDLIPGADDLLALMNACTAQISRRLQASLPH